MAHFARHSHFPYGARWRTAHALAIFAPAGATAAQRDRETRKLRKYLATFRAAGLVGVDGDTLADLTTGGCR